MPTDVEVEGVWQHMSLAELMTGFCYTFLTL